MEVQPPLSRAHQEEACLEGMGLVPSAGDCRGGLGMGLLPVVGQISR